MSSRSLVLLVLALALLGPGGALAQPIVEPGPPIVEPGPPIVQPGPPIVQPLAPAAPPPGPYWPPPMTAQREPRGRSASRQLVTGSILFGISHGAAVTLATILGPTDRQAWWLALPLGGPAVWGALWGCPDDPDDTCRTLLATAGGFWSAMQLGGMVTMIIGIARLPSSSAPSFAVGPLTVPGARGLAVWGSL